VVKGQKQKKLVYRGLRLIKYQADASIYFRDLNFLARYLVTQAYFHATSKNRFLCRQFSRLLNANTNFSASPVIDRILSEPQDILYTVKLPQEAHACT
jgi:hypothetical protein